MSIDDSAHLNAVDTLYSDHHDWLVRWLRSRLGCAHNAADLAQDTFTRILASRDATTVCEPRAYLTTIAKSLMVNWYRRQALERAYLDALAHIPETEVPAPEQHLIILETLHEIDRMLDSLAPKVRQTFLLSQIEGLKYEVIAEQLGVSLGSVKRYMQQAFRQCLLLM